MTDRTAYGMDPAMVGSPRIAMLYAHWRALCGMRDAPSRREIRPADIAPILPNLFLVDVVETPPGSGLPHWRIRYRLAGTACVRAANFDYTGRYLDEVVFNDLTENWQALHDIVTESRRPLFGRSSRPRDDGFESPFEFAMLPLSENGVAVTGQICIEDHDPADALAPHRFGRSRLRTDEPAPGGRR